MANDKSQFVDAEKQLVRQKIFEEFAVESPEVRGHKHAKLIVNAGVAAHHAGHIPSWKLLIERMMSGGLLNALFATSTVAAGVDFPARMSLSPTPIRGETKAGVRLRQVNCSR